MSESSSNNIINNNNNINNNSNVKLGGTKPRLSFISSKQPGIRLKSEDQPDQQITILSATPDDYANLNSTLSTNEDPSTTTNIDKTLIIGEKIESQQSNETHRFASQNTNLDKEQQPQQQQQTRLNGDNIQDDLRKMNISKEDLIRIITLLKYELQTKETALAAIKCEQLKRLINPVEISRSSLANTYIELQDRFKARDQNNNSNNKTGANSSSASQVENQESENQQTKDNSNHDHDDDGHDDEDDRESLNILNTLLELLDRHPLLALPRDSIYCLDYNCNELSTKNYLNLKIQHLDNLITQHRRFRFFMNERLRRSEKRYLDLARQLELERSVDYENERSAYKASGKTILLKHIDQLKEALEKEKRDKQVIVMTLLNELLDGREQLEAASKKLAEYEVNSASSNTGEREKLLRMESELSNLNTQLKKQSMVFAKEKNELQSKIAELETENLSLKNKTELLERRLAAPSLKHTQATSSSSSSDTKELGHQTSTTTTTTIVQSSLNRSNQHSSGSSSGFKLALSRSSGKQILNPTAPVVVSRSSIGSSQAPVTRQSPIRAPPNNQRPANKPQVPAKPAQLLDQQRNSLVL